MRHKLPRRMQLCFPQAGGLVRSLQLLIALASSLTIVARSDAADENGIALAIVYDTSGSMKEPVRTADGRREPKHLIGNRALEQIIRRLEVVATNAGNSKPIHAGLFVFRGTGAAEAVKFGPFNAQSMLNWIKQYRGPDSGTPLGTT